MNLVTEIKNYPNIPKIDFIYSLREINSKIENSLIIESITTSDLKICLNILAITHLF